MRVILLVILQVLLYKGLNCQLVFKDSPASATVLVNYPTTLRCTANEPDPPASIVWLKDSVITESDPRGRFSVSYNPTTGRSEYIINTVNYFDDGNYQCYAVNATANIVASSAVGRLTVQGHPGFAHPLQSVVVPLGGTAVFECPVLSNPPANVSWALQGGSPITSDSRRLISPATTLTITNVQATDEQFYVCIANNEFGRNTTTARLTIGTPPPELNPTITPGSPDPLVLNQGDILSLTCTVTPGSIFSSLTWTRGSSPITNIAQTSNTLLLSIPSVEFEDGGVYACTAVDNSGGTEVALIRVEVNVPPRFTITPQDLLVVENQPFDNQVNCTAVGEPNPMITWFRADGTVIPLVDGIPQLGPFARNDAGVFACVASNSVEAIRHEFTVTVQGRPLFSVSPTTTEASFGQDVVFQCVARGPPQPEYLWTRKGDDGLPNGTVISSDSTRLLLFSVTDGDEGTYQCSATNEFGSVLGEAGLTVLARPQILDATYGPLYLEAGTSFTLTCTFTGPPSVQQIWTLNGVPLMPSQDPNLSLGSDGSLSVINSQEQYSGEYVCNVSTSYSFDLVRVTVLLGSTPQFTTPSLDTDLLPGSTATLSCAFTGQPQPWSTWFKTSIFDERRELPTIGSTFTKLSTGLELHDVTRDDSGVYECLVDNGIGSVQQFSTVRVEGAPIVSGIQPTELSEGDTNVFLECITDFNFPAGSVSWTRTDGTELSAERFNVSSSGMLLITVVTAQDQAEYQCTLTNVYGTSSTNATVSIFVSPIISFESTEIIVEVGTKFSLVCPASGTPSPTIGWLLNGMDIDSSSGYVVDPSTGNLLLNDPAAGNTGTVTCVATNLVGTTSADVDILVRGPAVETLSLGSVTTTVVLVTWSAPPPVATLLNYQLEYGRPGRDEGRETRQLSSTTSFSIVSNLLPGTMYEFILRGVFSGGLIGLERAVTATTTEEAPSGPPQNITLSPSGGGFSVSWTLPLENERNGVILSYRIFYRVAPSNATIDPPFTNTTYLRNETEVNHFLSVSDLEEEVTYQVKLLASTAVGDGPESALSSVTTMRRVTFNPVDFPLVLNIVIGIGASVLGSLLLVALILAMCLLCNCCVKLCRKHKRLREEEERRGSRRKSQKGRNYSVSAPIPGIAPKIDDSADGKFAVRGKDGRVLNLKPKVITEEDVAPPPRDGENVQVVPHDKILLSQGGADAYNQPADALDGGYDVPKSQNSQRLDKHVVRPGSGIYSEVYDTHGGKDQTDGPSQGRDAAEESDSDLQLAEPEVIVIQPPSPERRGPEGDETGRDSAQLIYASISDEHKQKKREKRSKEQEKQDKQEKKMQEKMERERKKQEERLRKQEEKERKKRAKDQQARASLGLDNVVHLHELDMSKQGSRAQAEFIDAATAALF